MEKVTTVRELIRALKKLDQDAVVLVTPFTGSTCPNFVSNTVCVDYVSTELWPTKAVLISE